MQNPHPYDRAPMVGEIVSILGHGPGTFEVKSVNFKAKTFDALDKVTGFPLKGIPWGGIIGGEVGPHAGAASS
jgi:hypothetical protein